MRFRDTIGLVLTLKASLVTDLPLSDILQKTALFSGLEPAALQAVQLAAHTCQSAAGSYFFLQGDPAERVFLLTRGRVKLTQMNPDGSQVLLRAVGPGTLFGAVALAQGELYPVSAESAEDSGGVYWGAASLQELVLRHPQMALNAMSLMAERVQEFQQRFRELATERVERRLARALLRLASQTGRKVAEGVLIDLPLTRQDLAEMTGTTLFTVSRILNQWETRGLVTLGRERVIVRFPHGLVAVAEDLVPPQTSQP